jgi:hypothetical protein
LFLGIGILKKRPVERFGLLQRFVGYGVSVGLPLASSVRGSGVARGQERKYSRRGHLRHLETTLTMIEGFLQA